MCECYNGHKDTGLRKAVSIWPDAIQNTETMASSAPQMMNLCQSVVNLDYVHASKQGSTTRAGLKTDDAETAISTPHVLGRSTPLEVMPSCR